MRMSIRTTVGRSGPPCRPPRARCSPRRRPRCPASPASSMRKPARTIDWSSATSTRMRHRRRRSSGRRALRTKPPPGAVPARHLAAVDLDALADADEPVAEAVARRGALAVVADLDLQLVGPVADGHVRVAGARVLERVGQALLHDPIGGEVDRAREREGLAVDVQPHGKPGAADLVQRASRGRRGPAGARARRRRRRGASPRAGGASRRAPCGRPARRRASASLSSASVSGSLCRTAPTWSTITLTAWATMSWSSRAIRARSSATAIAGRRLALSLGVGRALPPPLRPARPARAARSRRARRSRRGAG